MVGVALACVGGAVALASVAGASPGGSAAAHAVVFRDTAGEHAGGPDVTAVTVASDASFLSFRVAMPGIAAVTEDMRIQIWLDTDDDRGTGLTVEDLVGVDNFLLVDPTRFGLGRAVLYTCAESICSGPASLRPVEFAYERGASFTVDASSLGLQRIERVSFWVRLATGIGYDPSTRQYDFTNWRADDAPDAGTWTFDARPLRVTRFRSSPSQPRAGRRFILSLRAVQTETGAAPAGARVSCSLRIAGIPVRGEGRFAGGTATCAFPVPRGSRGDRFRASIRVQAAGAAVSRTVSGRVG